MTTLAINPAKNVTISPAIPAEIVAVTEVTVTRIDDDCTSSVVAHLSIEGITKTLLLWEGNDYNTIGDWTQAQANARIIELLN